MVWLTPGVCGAVTQGYPGPVEAWHKGGTQLMLGEKIGIVSLAVQQRVPHSQGTLLLPFL